jgi:cell division protein FtsI/penicillin-binding protein 2
MASRKLLLLSAKTSGSRGLRRSLLLTGILALWMLALIARLYYFQVIHYVDWLGRAQRQQQRTIEVAPQRGVIFDRQLNPLAMSLDVKSICAVPSEIPAPNMVARLLAPALGLDPAELLGRFKAFRTFCWVKRKATTEEAARVAKLNLKGIYFQGETKRFYPKGELAASVLGYVGLDDLGLAGLEYVKNDAIEGRPGRVLVASDARHRRFNSTERQGQPGKNIVLTLDETVQYIAERALAEAVAKWHAPGGTVIVQNPNTGEILAMANQPTFNPNAYSKSPPGAEKNRAIGWVYEPGSTFKLVTLSAALEQGLANPLEVVDCQHGSIELARHVIHDHKPFGNLTVTDVMVDSSDVGAIKLGLRLGPERFYRYIRTFGFGSKTGIELPGEERGLIKPPNRWSGISIGELSIGQEVGVTPLQLVTAYAAVANGGLLYQPRIVHDVFLNKEHDPLPPISGRRVLSARTAAVMKEILAAVVERGTGVSAQLNGYSAAGKTGTAQKAENGLYSKTHYISSFVGFAPVPRPAVTILVVIDSPVGAIHGAEVAAPVFRSIAEQTLEYLNVPQDNPSQTPAMATSIPVGVPVQKRGRPAGHLPKDPEFLRAATSPIRPAAFLKNIPSRRLVESEPGSARASGPLVLDGGPLVTVPDFSGWAARRIADECEKLGLELSVSGTGLAVEQAPRAGSRLPGGSRVWVRLAR